MLCLGQALEKVGGKEFQQEVKDILASNGPLETAAGIYFFFFFLTRYFFLLPVCKILHQYVCALIFRKTAWKRG